MSSPCGNQVDGLPLVCSTAAACILGQVGIAGKCSLGSNLVEVRMDLNIRVLTFYQCYPRHVKRFAHAALEVWAKIIWAIPGLLRLIMFYGAKHSP